MSTRIDLYAPKILAGMRVRFPEPVLLTLARVAAEIPCTTQTLDGPGYRKHPSEPLPVVRVAVRAIRVSSDQLIAWLERRTTPAPAKQKKAEQRKGGEVARVQLLEPAIRGRRKRRRSAEARP